MSDLRIGISGWRYADWRGQFYPKGLAQKDELRHVARHFDTVELNGSFYSLQTPASYTRWAAETGDGFVFAVKGGGFITHRLRLKNVRPALANFFASGLLALDRKLGPILWQFPPHMVFNAERFAAFFDMLPRTRKEAAALAREHNDKLRAPPFAKALSDGPVRHCVEVRHASFFDPAFAALCGQFGIAVVLADTAGKHPRFDAVTGDFAYYRLHGTQELYRSRYSDDELAVWAARIDGDRKLGRDVYVYFDNTDKRHAPADAVRLREMLGGEQRRRA